MEEIEFLCFFLIVISVIVSIFIVIKNKRANITKIEERIIKEKGKIAFERIKIGSDLRDVFNLLSDIGIEKKLISEEMTDQNKRKKVYIWEFPFEYEIGNVSGGGITLMDGYNGSSYGTQTGYTVTGGTLTAKAYIKIVFINDTAAAKEQRGL